MDTSKTTYERVQDYYSKRVQRNSDLKTNACCTSDAIPREHREILAQLDDEILMKFYGCGSPIPPALEGQTVLDLGCGTGRDVYLASKLAGPGGHIIGLDMTDEQLEVARRHVDKQMQVFGFSKPNVEFRKGYIEDLAAAGIADNSVDVVISNCVINLSPEKEAVFSEIFRVLKPGGEMYVSDVFADRRIPAHLREDIELYGECLSGALYIEDFRRMLQKIGIADYRVVSSSDITIDNEEVEEKIGMVSFTSKTIRAFKLDSLEDICEDYGQVAIYKGTIPGHPHRFMLDDHHLFERGRAVAVCGNTASMLQDTRYGAHFTIIGDRSTHLGAFDCSAPAAGGNTSGDSCGC